MRASLESWKTAQIEERKMHTADKETAIKDYALSYEQYFSYVETSKNQKGKSIIEIGCADIPALYFCSDYNQSYIIEPMPSAILTELIQDKQIILFSDPSEELEFPKVDEIWLFNVLQHVIDPDVIINKAKESASVIRFFEPINCVMDICHLHYFTLDYFIGHFGLDAVKHYEDHKKK